MSQRFGRSHPAFDWVKAKKGAIPPNAVQGGFEKDGKPLFVARGLHKGSLIPGKAAPHIGGMYVPYDGKEKLVTEYEVLVGDAHLLCWKECTGRIQLQGWSPLEVGYEADGRELFVGKTRYDGGEVIGKTGQHMANGLMFGYDIKEIGVKETDYYYILAVPKNVSS